MPKHEFLITLGNTGWHEGNRIEVDGHDITSLLRGITIRADVGQLTTIELHLAPGAAAATLLALVEGAQVGIVTSAEIKRETPEDP